MALTKITEKIIADASIKSTHLHGSHGITTSHIGEGSNEYHTTARARAAVSVAGSLAYNNSTGIITFAQRTDGTIRCLLSVTESGSGDGSLAYNNSTGVITYTGPSASEVRAHFSAGTGIAISSGEISSHAIYTHPTTAGNKHVPTGGSSGQHLKYSASGTAVWAAETGHDSLSGFVANEHIDWTADQGGTNLHAGNYTNTTYSSSDFTHDDLTGFVANEHLDWTADQGSSNIHVNNLTPVALTTIQTAANQSAQLALTTEEGDVVVRSDEKKTYMRNSGSAGNMADFTLMQTPTDAVTSVSGATGVVVDSDIDHDATTNFVANEHIDWTSSSAGTLHATNIANDAIDSQHYAAGSIDLEHMSVNSIDSTQYVDGSIDLAHMSADSVDSAQYVDGSIDLAHMSADSVDSAQYVDGSIDLVHMSADSIDSTQYVDGSIDLAHMSVNSIDSDQYVDGSIDLAHMSVNSIDSDQYVDGSIDTDHLADDAVTSAKLDTNIAIGGTLGVTGVVTVGGGSGTVTSNLTGNVSGNATTATTVVGSVQTNIAQVGTLTALAVDGAVTINESGADVDFRVESDDNANMLFVDGGNDNVGIGTATPNEAGYGADTTVLSIQGASADNFGVLELISPDVTSSNRLGEITFGNLDGGSSFSCSSRIRGYRDGADNSSGLSFWTTNAGTITERMRIDSAGSFIFNEDSHDTDFRVESNASTHMLFVDGGANTVGINRTPTQSNTKLEVGGADNVPLIAAEASGVFAGLGTVSAVSGTGLYVGTTLKFVVGSSGQIGINGASYGTDGQVFTSGGSGAAAAWEDASEGVSTGKAIAMAIVFG